ncbi:glutathione peroxidase 7-like [Physella acuta]|uniref:glutathione peroxidase 7-like n=1 Tax=Physella acuta TaxID=109671 RepID=UPI0027DC6D54|nr:glutathione peroxidase 7-like [Physella acuta]
MANSTKLLQLQSFNQFFSILVCIHLLLTQLPFVCGEEQQDLKQAVPEGVDFYSFNVQDINNNIVSLEKYRGQVTLVVNVASECGYTEGHYRGLEQLQNTYATTQKFSVLAFPCNQFGEQEPGTHEEILHFATTTMGATFPLFAKVDVVGPKVPDAWSYLIKYSSKTPTWNFWKYLVDHNGHVLNAWGPSVNPQQLHSHIKDAINNIPQEQTNSKQREDNEKDEF